jgi:hypothetical protein
LQYEFGYFTAFYQRVLLFSAYEVWNGGYVFSTRRDRGLFKYIIKEGKGKGKAHPRTGHEDPKGE